MNGTSVADLINYDFGTHSGTATGMATCPISFPALAVAITVPWSRIMKLDQILE